MYPLYSNLYKIALVRYQVRFCSQTDQNLYDLVVVGGGIVGSAAARHVLKKNRKLKVALVEKEDGLARHQTGHNSGVIHAGIYYKPGTLKAKLCVKGLHLMYDYAEKNNIPHKRIGKLILATERNELEPINALYKRALCNRVPDISLIDGSEICAIEPNTRGLKAIYSPYTGILDYAVVAKSFAKDFVLCGGDIFCKFKVAKFVESSNPDYPINVIAENRQNFHTKYVLTCAGLYSDLLAQLSGGDREPAIIPVRGEYLIMAEEFEDLIRGNIYPVPMVGLPFLGVHFTKRISGRVWLGPNAIPAFRREGYRWSDFNFSEFYKMITYPGFIRLGMKYPTFGLSEMFKSWCLRCQMRDIKRFVPMVERSMITRGPSGVRAQAMTLKGEMIDDFVFESGTGTPGKFILHCRNAPSPGATSSLAIAEMISEKLNELYYLDQITINRDIPPKRDYVTTNVC